MNDFKKAAWSAPILDLNLHTYTNISVFLRPSGGPILTFQNNYACKQLYAYISLCFQLFYLLFLFQFDNIIKDTITLINEALSPELLLSVQNQLDRVTTLACWFSLSGVWLPTIHMHYQTLQPLQLYSVTPL